jgi:hypothetical protein
MINGHEILQGPPQRKLSNWIASFIEFSDVLASPRIFRKWSAISILSAVMERRLWVRTKGSNLYPNLYTILVGPPGVGKSAVLSQVERFLRAVPDIHVAPSSVSAASLVDSLVLAKRQFTRIHEVPNAVQFHYLTAVASELGVFLPVYDPLFMNSLTKFYDGEHYEERRRTGKVPHLKIEHPHLSIIGGTTPSYLNSFLPEGAWDQGFTSRTIFIYEGVAQHQELFDEDDRFDELDHIYKDLLDDLKSIVGLYGKFSWSPEAAAAISEWNRNKCEPIPTHNKLQHYNSRRLAHCIKLCMVASIARSNEMVITLEDYQEALGWLLDAESRVVDIFHSMGVAGDSAAIEDTWDFIFRSYNKSGKRPVGEHAVVNFLRTKVPSHNIMRIIEVMVKSGIIRLDCSTGVNGYVPAPRAD